MLEFDTRYDSRVCRWSVMWGSSEQWAVRENSTLAYGVNKNDNLSEIYARIFGGSKYFSKVSQTVTSEIRLQVLIVLSPNYYWCCQLTIHFGLFRVIEWFFVVIKTEAHGSPELHALYYFYSFETGQARIKLYTVLYTCVYEAIRRVRNFNATKTAEISEMQSRACVRWTRAAKRLSFGCRTHTSNFLVS